MNRFATTIFALSAATMAFSGAAHAASAAEKVSMCVEALEAAGQAPADGFTSKMVSMSGASVTKITVKLTPDNGGEAIEATCKVKRGKVVETIVEA